MPQRLSHHRPKEPRWRVIAVDGDPTVTFYPNEVARSLAIEVIDYRQLRTFYKLIRDQPSNPGAVSRGWSRFTITDMASLLVALRCCGGEEALQPGRRLVTADLARACTALKRQGYERPLLEVNLHRVNKRVMAEIDGLIVDPITGQTAILEVVRHVDRYFDGRLLHDPVLSDILRAEIDRHRSTIRSA